MSESVKIFIGSGEASLLERKVLIYSLTKHATRQLDIRVFNGTHDSLERNGDSPAAIGMPLEVKYRNVTEFSNYRFFIPTLCNHTGRAIWLDSDSVCLADISELFDAPMPRGAVLAKRDAYGDSGEERWGLSVSLYDCSRCTFDVQKHFDEIRSGLYSYTDLHQLTPRFRLVHPIEIESLDPNWNSFDRYDSNTRLIHYTNLLTQPWKYRGHPYGDLWFKYFSEARREGFITSEDIELTIVRGYARQDLLGGNDWSLGALTWSYMTGTKRLFEGRLRRLLG